MSGRLKEEIKQAKPFPSLKAEAILSVQRTADLLTRAVSEALKPADISPAQYNALRILKGAGKEGRTCNEIGERMVTRDPDITRLLDRLEDRGLATRVRSDQDRRVVNVRITPKGKKAILDLDPVFRQLEGDLLKRMGEERLRSLIELLEDVREGLA